MSGEHHPFFVTLDSNFSVDDREIIGIFDLDNSTRSQDTRRFLRESEKRGDVTTRSRDIPKSFLLCDGFVCLLQTSSTSLANRFKL